MEYTMPMWARFKPAVIKPEYKYAPRCPCVNEACSRNGFCVLCAEFHEDMDHPPICRRREETPLNPAISDDTKK